ncbi:MAG: RNA 2',3'-cyclic phosphodiesterase [Candidatus Sericytochromatia bacterium]
MRLFTAIAFPPDVIAELKTAQEWLRGRVDAQRWQSLANAHLTLHFLGETPEPMLAPLEAVMASGCAQAAPFDLALGAFGGFPNLARARVLWLGVGGERDRLLALEARLRPAIAAVGLDTEDRAYKPHITLAREPDRHASLAELPDQWVARPMAWRVDEVLLFRSELKPQGAVHTVMGRYPLLGGR